MDRDARTLLLVAGWILVGIGVIPLWPYAEGFGWFPGVILIAVAIVLIVLRRWP